MVKAVIFDLDGTLLNSVEDIADNINLMLKKFGYNTRTVDEIKSFIGHGARNLVKNSLGGCETDARVDECLAYYNDIYTNSGSPKTRLFEGVDKMLLALKQKGYKLAILTNKPQMTTDEVYKEYLSKYSFDKVVGQRGNVKIKPDPTVVNQIINELGVSKENVYFVGDGEPDAQVAINAQVNGICVLWGFRTRRQLEDAGATVFAESPDKVVQLIG